VKPFTKIGLVEWFKVKAFSSSISITKKPQKTKGMCWGVGMTGNMRCNIFRKYRERLAPNLNGS
jgi:hypothetical protein